MARRTPDELTVARAKADRTRAEWMMMLRSGMVGINDVLSAAHQHEPLKRIKLTQLLAAQPDVSVDKAKAMVEKFRRLSARRHPGKTVKVPENPPVSYLINRRGGPRLWGAWQEATTEMPLAPWGGFPHTRRPSS